MPYVLSIVLPNLSDGAGLTIDGLGVFEAGKLNVVSDEEVEAYLQANITVEPAYVVDDDGNETQVGMNQVHPTFEELIGRYEGLSAERIPDVEEDADEENDNHLGTPEKDNDPDNLDQQSIGENVSRPHSSPNPGPVDTSLDLDSDPDFTHGETL